MAHTPVNSRRKPDWAQPEARASLTAGKKSDFAPVDLLVCQKLILYQIVEVIAPAARQRNF